MWPQLGAPFGFFWRMVSLSLTIVFGFRSGSAQIDDQFLVWGWGIPFLMSIVMVLIGLYVRIKLD